MTLTNPLLTIDGTSSAKMPAFYLPDIQKIPGGKSTLKISHKNPPPRLQAIELDKTSEEKAEKIQQAAKIRLSSYRNDNPHPKLLKKPEKILLPSIFQDEIFQLTSPDGQVHELKGLSPMTPEEALPPDNVGWYCVSPKKDRPIPLFLRIEDIARICNISPKDASQIPDLEEYNKQMQKTSLINSKSQKIFDKAKKVGITIPHNEVRDIVTFIHDNPDIQGKIPPGDKHTRTIEVFQKENHEKQIFIDFNRCNASHNDPIIGEGTEKKAKYCISLEGELFIRTTQYARTKFQKTSNEIAIATSLRGKKGVAQLLFTREYKSKKGRKNPKSKEMEYQKLALFWEYYDGKNLKEVFHEKTLSPKEKYRIAHDILEGLETIHKNGIIHRDIKPANMYCSKDLHAIIGDFGCAIGPEELSAPLEGTPATMAPEILEKVKSSLEIKKMLKEEICIKLNSPKADIWSIGLILGQLYKDELSSELNKWLENHLSLSQQIGGWSLATTSHDMLAIILNQPPENTTEIEVLVRKMLAYEPEKRPSAEEVLVEFDEISSTLTN